MPEEAIGRRPGHEEARRPPLAEVARGGTLNVAGGALAFAGLYQLTPLKNACLSRCRSPLGFLLGDWREGSAGAVEMGSKHAAWCVGCCWAYMLVMLVVGVMSIPAMVALAGVIALEKVIVRGNAWFTRGVAVAFAIAGLVALVFPDLFASLPL